METEQDDVALDENIVSASDCDDDWTCIVGGVPCLEMIFYAMNFAIILLVMFVSNGLTLFVACLNGIVYVLLSTSKCWCIHIHVW